VNGSQDTPDVSEKRPSFLKRLALVVLGVFAIFALGIQAMPVDRSNPPVTMAVDAPPEVLSILKRSCFDCHSNETVWPWYSKVAPITWRIADHVRHGRGELNFSMWDKYDAEKRADLIEECYEESSEGHMPLPDYLRMHPEAVLSGEDLTVLRAWAGSIEDH